MTTETPAAPEEGNDAQTPPGAPRPSDGPAAGEMTAGAPGGAPLPPAPATAPRTNVLAIVALVSSFFVGLAGIICGAISLRQLKRTGERGRGLAIAGIVVGGAQIVLGIVVSIMLIIAAAAIGVSSAVNRAADDLPKLPSTGTTLECGDLTERLTQGAASLKEASATASSDPGAALAALTAFSADLKSAAAETDDPALAAAVRDAAAEVDDFAAAMRPLVDNPSGADPSGLDEVFDHIKSVTAALVKVQAACAAAATP